MSVEYELSSISVSDCSNSTSVPEVSLTERSPDVRSSITLSSLSSYDDDDATMRFLHAHDAPDGTAAAARLSVTSGGIAAVDPCWRDGRVRATAKARSAALRLVERHDTLSNDGGEKPGVNHWPCSSWSIAPTRPHQAAARRRSSPGVVVAGGGSHMSMRKFAYEKR